MMIHFMRLAATLAASVALTGCAALFGGAAGVSVSGINHTDKSFSYLFVDPTNPENRGGGESVGPFGGGGVMCCYALPPKWDANLKVKVKLYDERRDFVREELVAVPRYANGKPQQLWAVLHADGSVEAVASDVAPDHADWPGKIRGWPVPSLKYRRFLWQREVNSVKASIKLHEDSLEDFSLQKMEDRWKHDTKYNKKEISAFSGPSDPDYIAYLRKRYEEMLTWRKGQLQKLEEIEP